MVWCGERNGPRADQAARVLEQSGHAVDARGFDGLLERHRRQDRGNALGQHGFAGAGRAQKDNVVAAGAGDFERALGALLAADVAQVHRILRGFGEQGPRVDLHGRERFRRVHQVHRLRQRFDGVDLDAFHDGGFARVGLRHDQRADALLAHAQRRGERAAHRPHAAVEREFAEENVTGERLAEERALAAENSQRHRADRIPSLPCGCRRERD